MGERNFLVKKFMKYLIRKNVKIGKNSLIDEGVEIGRLHKGINEKKMATVIGNNSILRRGTIIYVNVQIGNNFQTGHNTLIRENNIIGDNVSIGSNTELALRNRIGNNTRIHSGCFLEDVVLGKNVFVGPNVTFTNDPHPSCPDRRDCFGGAKVSDFAKIGAGVVILPHVKIGKHALVGAGSVVVKDVPDYAVVIGNPARKIKNVQDIVCKIKDKNHKPYEKHTVR